MYSMYSIYVYIYSIYIHRIVYTYMYTYAYTYTYIHTYIHIHTHIYIHIHIYIHTHIYIYGILKELTNTLIQSESLEGTRIKNKFVGIRDLSLAGSC